MPYKEVYSPGRRDISPIFFEDTHKSYRPVPAREQPYAGNPDTNEIPAFRIRHKRGETASPDRPINLESAGRSSPQARCDQNPLNALVNLSPAGVRSTIMMDGKINTPIGKIILIGAL